MSGLPTDAKARKAIPIYSGFFKYFPRAIAAVAELSRIGNDQHNPGKPLHWDRSKSGDEKDAMLRHLLDQALQGDDAGDTDGVLHATKKAWRSMADLEKILEAKDAGQEDDGWIKWEGGDRPTDEYVDVKLKGEEVGLNVAELLNHDPRMLDWSGGGWIGQIIAYRKVKA